MVDVSGERALGFHESAEEILACPHYCRADNPVRFAYFGSELTSVGHADLPAFLSAVIDPSEIAGPV
jgi:hypothetical protein